MLLRYVAAFGLIASAYIFFLIDCAEFAAFIALLVAFRMCSFRAYISFVSSFIATKANFTFPLYIDFACLRSSLVVVSATTSFSSASLRAS